MELNKIYFGDSIQLMKLIEDNSIDLIITDPPYGDNQNYGRLAKGIENNSNPLISCQALFEFQRILKINKTCYIFSNWKHYPFLTEFIMRYTFFSIRTLIVCNKNNIGLGYGFRNKHELILVLEKGEPEYNQNDLPNVLDFKMPLQNEESHPHQKPTELIKRLICNSSKENDIILDAFVGSGSIYYRLNK